jgi:hypothetical protein
VGLTFSLTLFFTSFSHALNLLQKILGAINKQMHSLLLPCSLIVAATGKRNMVSGCWFYDSEIPNYVFVKTPKHFAWPYSFNFVTAKCSSL